VLAAVFLLAAPVAPGEPGEISKEKIFWKGMERIYWDPGK
jgi:hypothetical protein